MDLYELGKKYKTDKCNKWHTYHGVNYLHIYQKFLESKRLNVKTFVEIGVNNGASLKMWQEYFPNAIIYGIDIDPRCKQYESERIKIFIGSQNDITFLKKIKKEIGDIDVLLDDGSHITRHQITSFNELYSNIKSGGLYIIEDLACSYEEHTNHHNIRQIWPGMKYNDKNDPLKNYRKEFVDFIEEHVNKLDKITYGSIKDDDYKLLSIHHYPQIVIFENL